ncbi:MAG TPA: hypothetical protein VHY37_14145 [Tepidisphaeraceae bacterium]|jgi:hypothetical protein|nr:hypothetical protein [Tepidisphaeraceae bacterium]
MAMLARISSFAAVAADELPALTHHDIAMRNSAMTTKTAPKRMRLFFERLAGHTFISLDSPVIAPSEC